MKNNPGGMVQKSIAKLADNLTRRNAHVVITLLIVGVFFAACSDDDGNPSTTDDGTISVPTAYSFLSQFEESVSSVSYSGQTVRNLLVQDIKILIDRAASGGAVTEAELLALYEHDDAQNLSTLTSVGNPFTPKEEQYSSISTGKRIFDPANPNSSKISRDPIIGYNVEADVLIRDWFAKIAANSADGKGDFEVYIDENNVDMNQMINKVLLGALIYYQGTGWYLNGVLDQDNSGPRISNDEADPYTAMEHFWDEAFGYFGAARNYSAFSDAELAGSADGQGRLPFVGDSNGDGEIDFKSEYNFGFSRNAGKRDKPFSGGGSPGVDFSGDIFEAFLQGRTAITNRESAETIARFRKDAANGWEKVIAATVVHYINDTMSDMAALGSESYSRKNHLKHWAEMRAFTIALQFSGELQIITDAELTELHNFMGVAPKVTQEEVDAYTTALTQARDLIGSVYGFTSDQLANW